MIYIAKPNKTINEINRILEAKYAKTEINGQPFFVTNRKTPFRVQELTGSFHAFVIEYADTWEDGDCFFPEDYASIEDMAAAMMREIDSE